MRFMYLFLAGLLCAGFTACGDDEETTAPSTQNSQTTEKNDSTSGGKSDDIVVVPEAVDTIHGSTTVAWSTHIPDSIARRLIDNAFFVVDAKTGSGKHYVRYNSTLWGATKGANYTFTGTDQAFAFNGADSITMKRMGNGPEANYYCKIEGIYNYNDSARQISATIDVLKDNEIMYKLSFNSK